MGAKEIFIQNARQEAYGVYLIYPAVDPEHVHGAIGNSIKIAEGLTEIFTTHGGHVVTGLTEEQRGIYKDRLFIRTTREGGRALEEKLGPAGLVSKPEFDFYSLPEEDDALAESPEITEAVTEVAIKVHTYGMEAEELPFVRPTAAELGIFTGQEVKEPVKGRAVAFNQIDKSPGEARRNLVTTIEGITGVLAGHGGRIVTGEPRSWQNGFIIVETMGEGVKELERKLEGAAFIWEHKLADLSNLYRFQDQISHLAGLVPEEGLGWDAVMWLDSKKRDWLWDDEAAVRLMRGQYAQRMSFLEGYFGTDGLARLRDAFTHSGHFTETLWRRDYQQKMIAMAGRDGRTGSQGRTHGATPG